MNNIDKLTISLKKRPMSRDLFDESYDFEYLVSMGLGLVDIDGFVFLKSSLTDYRKDTYVIFDLEFDGKDIIEIGAVKIQDLKVIDEFSMLVYKEDIDKNVSRITGITLEMLKDAKDIEQVLIDFKLFILDSILVAHNIGIDYKLLSNSLDRYGLDKLANEKICTQVLAGKMLQTEKKSLKYLKELFNINIFKGHRAYDDAITTMYILLKFFKMFPKRLKTSKDILKFANS